jgi:hypothetical protein
MNLRNGQIFYRPLWLQAVIQHALEEFTSQTCI